MPSNVGNQVCILGIKINGVSYNITTLNISDDQTAYDYICNVNPSSNVNGNGSYIISILNKELVKGMPLGKWTLLEGSIFYDWGESRAIFCLLDENGVKTKLITASCAKGSASGFKVENLARSIFAKAREIISEFPSANIYNAYSSFHFQKLSEIDVKRFTRRDDVDEIIKTFEKDTIEAYSNYIASFQRLKEELLKSEDERSKRLLIQAKEECVKTIMLLK